MPYIKSKNADINLNGDGANLSSPGDVSRELNIQNTSKFKSAAIRSNSRRIRDHPKSKKKAFEKPSITKLDRDAEARAANSSPLQPDHISIIKSQQTVNPDDKWIGLSEQKESLKGIEGSMGGPERKDRIKVIIGRIEVRVDSQPLPLDRRQKGVPVSRSSPRLSLESYLKQRNEGRL